MNGKRIVLGIMMAALVAAAFADMGYAQEKRTRVYELRTYTVLPGRLPALHKRFAEHTMKLFEKHGIRSELYWVPVDKENTLIYFVSHESMEALDRNWKAFYADPEWIRARDASEADGKILAKPPDRVFMKLTDYSPVR
ncbi:MAG TPA: NIPSNAP family protein [Thermodesulfobacteriota bacterium]|nr:NIPSNAP family protein [Thermodesulfobacteriota bacterium]